MRDAFARDVNIEPQFLAATPAGRIGMPEEIASSVSWLTSEGAGFVTGKRDLVSCGRGGCLRGALTGQTVNVNGGMYFD